MQKDSPKMATKIDEDIYEIKSDITLLKRDMGAFGETFSKIEQTVDKIQEAITSMTRMITLHEERIAVQNKEDDDLEKLIVEIKKEIKGEIDKIEHNIELHKKEMLSKITKLSLFRALVIGGVSVIGMLVASVLNGYFQAYFKSH